MPAFREQVLIEGVPPSSILRVTRNGLVFGIVPAEGDSYRFLWDDVKGEPFTGLLPTRDKQVFFASPDAEHIAYIGVAGDQFFVGRDGCGSPLIVRRGQLLSL